MLKVGDHVIVVKSAKYNVTKPGSFGIVESLFDEFAAVKFLHTTGSISSQFTFDILKKDLRKLTKLDRALK